MPPADQSSPNLIWLFGDQHRAQSVGYAGDPNLTTPNLDRLAAESLGLQGVAGCPLCCPFRGSLLTSRYPHECVSGHEDALPEDLPTVAHAFRASGYHTAWFGKWHLDGFHESKGRGAHHVVPPARRGGFDEWVGYENNNSQFDSWIHGTGLDQPTRLEGYETDALTDRFIAHLRRRAPTGQPFFAALSVQPPHDPYVAPEAWMRRHNPASVRLRPNVPPIARIQAKARRDLAGYHAMIENWDWNIGRIREALRETGLEAKTHLVFFSDHGDLHGAHGHFLKTTPHEESIRVPFLIGGVDAWYYGRRGSAPALVNHVDIAPTSLGLCGLPVPATMRGTDYSALRTGRTPPSSWPESAFLQYVRPTGQPETIARAWRGVVTTDGWKYIVLEHQPWLLFNLNEDPHELNNLAMHGTHRTERLRLHRLLAEWVDRTGDRFPLPVV